MVFQVGQEPMQAAGDVSNRWAPEETFYSSSLEAVFAERVEGFIRVVEIGSPAQIIVVRCSDHTIENHLAHMVRLERRECLTQHGPVAHSTV